MIGRPTAVPVVQAIAGEVVVVTDGDTIAVLDGAKTQHTIRLKGVDAPESGQPFGATAKQALFDKIFAKHVRVEWTERDKYGRVLGSVYIDDRYINRELVDEGWAWHYRQHTDEGALASAELSAKSAGRGLWVDSNPVAPWNFRDNASIRESTTATATTDREGAFEQTTSAESFDDSGQQDRNSASPESAARASNAKAAASKLALAKSLLRKRPSLGREWLRQVNEEYPGTDAAREAAELLSSDDP
jgi:endonuclease YncB( thermonuclease family)